MEAAEVSLRRWLRRQLRQPTPLREHLEAAVENNDPAEARKYLEKIAATDVKYEKKPQAIEMLQKIA